jgi:spermidine dehydrogenase
MDRPITRRDFIDGAIKASAVVTMGGVATPAISAINGTDISEKHPLVSAGYPPGLTGIRGQDPATVEVAHSMRDGRQLGDAEGTGELYDLIVVGAGMSGLSSAYYYRKALPKAKILILDACDDFGGHARRNEVSIGGRQLLMFGGTMELQSLQTFTPDGKALIADIGIDPDRFIKATTSGENQYKNMGMQTAAFFGKETYGVDRLVKGFPGFGGFASCVRTDDWAAFVKQSPLPTRVKEGLLKLANEKKDYMASFSAAEKVARLKHMSYQDFLIKIVGLDPGVTAFLYRLDCHDFNGAAGMDSYSAWAAFRWGKDGFAGMGLEQPPASWTDEPDQNLHFPDGNGGVARLLIRWLIPNALSGSTMEDSVVPHVDYAALDRATNDVRVRLSSTVFKVVHSGDPAKATEVEVTYLRGGKAYKAKGGACVMACFNAVVPHICPELPEPQKAALHMSVRMPIVYTNVAIRNWRAHAKLGVSNIYFPNGFHSHAGLDSGGCLGGYERSPSPDDPTFVNMWKTPMKQNTGLPVRDQFRTARAELLQMDFQTFERAVRDQLGRALSGAGFDPARDIEAIFVNRWGHGYAGCANELYDPEWTREELPWVVGRKRFGLIAIANSDAGATSLTQAAFDQGHRAVTEILTDVVRPQFQFPWGERT